MAKSTKGGKDVKFDIRVEALNAHISKKPTDDFFMVRTRNGPERQPLAGVFTDTRSGYIVHHIEGWNFVVYVVRPKIKFRHRGLRRIFSISITPRHPTRTQKRRVFAALFQS